MLFGEMKENISRFQTYKHEQWFNPNTREIISTQSCLVPHKANNIQFMGKIVCPNYNNLPFRLVSDGCDFVGSLFQVLLGDGRVSLNACLKISSLRNDLSKS